MKIKYSPIRQCAMQKGVDACGDCSEMEHCQKIAMIHTNNAEAKKNFK